jgi:uncharacterized membrane protein
VRPTAHLEPRTDLNLPIIVPSFLISEIILAGRNWLGVAVGLCLIALAVLAWAYARAGHVVWVRVLAGLLKATGILLLAALLVEPLFTGTRPRPGSNLFLVVADNSKSLQLADRGHAKSRGAAMKDTLSDQSSWLTRLAQDFDVRRYAFDSAPRPLKDFSEITLDGESSALRGTLAALGDRYRGQPIAGILLLTDGNATDLEGSEYDWKKLPPVYPVAVGSDSELVDVSVSRVSVTQTNFEASPVTITAEVAGQGIAGRKIVLRVLDESGKELERRTLAATTDGPPLAQRFLIKPEQPGISFYTVQASLEGEEDAKDGRTGGASTAEATLANNRRLATVDRGGGPFRVLYVCGRPNWEFKFLRRALDEDDELDLVGLVRIAKREPKFTFLGQRGERTNPLFRGFGNNADETAEQYDQPVLVRFGTEDQEELRGGFPQDADGLFRYHAIILDDVEAGFFKQDQLSLLQQFVSRRGGGLLMLGGKDSFAEGGYNRTPVGEMLPVYLDRHFTETDIPESFRLRLTREGLLQPWARLRANERDEAKRLESMPAFKAMNRVDSIKPGASILAEAEVTGEKANPALVVQTFGRGRVGALLLSDLWRWNLQRKDHKENDLDKAWRQTVRWLISDVPQPVEVETRRAAGGGSGVEIHIKARDKQFEPLDNAEVKLAVKAPDGKQIELVADSSDKSPGSYLATFSPRVAGAYRATISVTAADGSAIGERPAGWSIEPETEEFRTLAVNRPLLERLAKESGGEVIELKGLNSFVSGLPNRKIPLTESWTYPLWHQWQVFLLALVCLVGEWGLRRWKGLP